MLSILTPNLYFESVFDLTPEIFRGLGRRGLLLDVDCTLKDHGARDFSPRIQVWIESMRNEGAIPCLISNGKKKRIEVLAGLLNVPFVAKAFKPLPFGCRTALKNLGLSPTDAMIVGDQIFADVLAGRLAGMYTILVRPTSQIEPWFTRMKRPFERVVLKRLGRSPLASASCSQFPQELAGV